MNEYEENVENTAERASSERQIEGIRQRGGMFVEAVRVTRMPMLVTDATLPANPIVFANEAFIKLSGYDAGELLGQGPHFMNGDQTDPDAIRQYEAAIEEGRDETLEILQYRKDGTPFRAMLFACPLDDGQGTVTNHFLSYLDITRRYDAENNLRALTSQLEERVATRTRELEAANDRLANLLAERDMLLVEVNHRAKNSLSIASALLATQARRQPDNAVKAAFAETQDRLVAMARLHDLLSKSANPQQADVASYVEDLCGSLRPMAEHEDRIRLAVNAEKGIAVDADTAIPLGIVLTELITNAVKYAFPPPRSGTILARVQRKQPGRIEVVIQDDGIGISHLREGSLGYGLVRSLVHQIRGEIDVRSDVGVRATISFPESPHVQPKDSP